MGSLHAQAYRRVGDHYPELPVRPRLLVAADVDPQRAEAARRMGFESTTTDPYAVIADSQVEAVSITATNDVHVELIRAAAEAGKHVWVEKPVGRFPEETAAAAAAVEAAGVYSTVGFNYRQVPLVVHAQNLVAAGKLGSVRNYRGRFFVDYASNVARAFSWRFARDVAGLGALGDIMSHVIDQAHQMVGPIASVCAHQEIQIAERPAAEGATQFAIAAEGSKMRAVENDDYAVSLVHFENGARGVFEVCRTMVGRHCDLGFELHGTEGALGWSFQRMNELELYLPSQEGEDVGYRTVFAGPQHGDHGRFEPDTGVGLGYSQLKVSEANGFLASITDGKQRRPGIAEALASARVVDAMLRSAESGSWTSVGEAIAHT
ncbi:MAG: Gfo/Idh/MocA family oxidoreductase [Actinobacteria bacterium]|nr:Gfo/Idh/MocA family oxidoreductase [Actinomycetota bacterium]